MDNSSSRSHTATNSSQNIHMPGNRRNSTGSSDWDEDAAANRGDFTLAGTVKLARHIEEQVKANGIAEQRKGSKFVYVALLLAAVGFGLATFFLLKNSHEATFRSEFESYARETAEIANAGAANTFGQLKSLATAITSIANDDEHDDGEPSSKTRLSSFFPYTTIPHFDLRTQEISDLTGIEMIAFVPFVSAKDKQEWQRYAVDHQYWVHQDYEYRNWSTQDIQPIPEEIYPYPLPTDYNESRRGFVDSGFMEEVLSNLSYVAQGFSAPIAQFGPGPIDTSLAMVDLFSHPIFKKEIVASLEYDVPVISETEELQFLLEHIHAPINSSLHDYNCLRSFTLDPVKENFERGARTIGYLMAVVPWDNFFKNLLAETVNGIVVKVSSDCGRNFTYVVNGGKENLAWEGDWVDPKYEDMAQQYKFFWKEHPKGTSRHCHFDLYVYPSDDFHKYYQTDDPLIYAMVVVMICGFMALIFFMFDWYMQKKQASIMSEKARKHAVVNALFPAHVSQTLLSDKRGRKLSAIPNIMSLTNANKSKPLADLFPSATIMFADIAGFTAWSSVREPSMVFTLLESIYSAFDLLAKKRMVFKVETIGDCYVAVCGLPAKCPEHAIVMADFAKDCLDAFQALVFQLEVELGPDTAELGLRTGLHSGPVTAGVLRGERSRFQLFGDTVNTTARIESLGQAGRIHLSQETAEQIKAWNKEEWLIPRHDQVQAKGKGLLTTYWLDIPDDKSDFSDTETSLTDLSNAGRSVDAQLNAMDGKIQRLVDWNTELLLRLLEQISARRKAVSTGTRSSALGSNDEKKVDSELRRGKMVIDEVAEVITLPTYDQRTGSSRKEGMSKEISVEISRQTKMYVTRIARLYPDNPFHNFEHASHVTMSVSKLLSRIVGPKLSSESHRFQQDGNEMDAALHDHTYGITSDPLTQFACVFSALVHDAEHTGLPNAQLVKEGTALAARYKNVSVAEQNSVDVAWNILMEPEFKQLRAAIYSSEAEMIRFRQLVVNSVMATDIVDKRLKNLRNDRWAKAFDVADDNSLVLTSESHDDKNRKATIVIEHLIQASDISHTMQHWHVFRKWNQNLFREMYLAYKEGKADRNPAEFWYSGEIGFFTFYIIPLAKKLEDCGVFGVSSDEYLGYAEKNLEEWKIKGEAIVEEYVASAEDFLAGRLQPPKESPRASRKAARQLERIESREEFMDEFEFDGPIVEC